MRDGSAVIGDRNTLILCAAKAVFHFSVIEHAASAVDDELIRGQIIRELRSACKGKTELSACMFLDPVRQFDSAYIITLPVVRAPLRDENRVIFF